MKRSTNRILTTHTGSLIRPPRLLEFARARQAGQPIDQQAFDGTLKDAVGDVVKRQVAAGIDVPNDGEFGKSTSWSLYALKRLSGFELRQPVCARRRSGALPGVLQRARGTGRRQGLVERDPDGRRLRRADQVQRPVRAAA